MQCRLVIMHIQFHCHISIRGIFISQSPRGWELRQAPRLRAVPKGLRLPAPWIRIDLGTSFVLIATVLPPVDTYNISSFLIISDLNLQISNVYLP